MKESGKFKEYGYNKNYADNAGTKSFNLAYPYVIFILYLNQYNELCAGQAFLRIARLSGLSDYLLKIPMTNISDNQYICFGSKGGGSSYREIAGVSTYMEWQALSASNPMFIYNVEWIKIPMNLGQAIDEMKKHYKLASINNMEYQTLAQMFSTPLDSGKDEKPTKRRVGGSLLSYKERVCWFKWCMFLYTKSQIVTECIT